MDKKTMLLHIINDYKEMQGNKSVEVIEFCRHDGTKAGIGNGKMIDKMINFVICEAEKELELLKEK